MYAASQINSDHPYKSIKILSKVCILLFLVLMLIFPTASFTGAKRGLLLWFNTVLPTLLPFIIISNLIIRLQLTKPLSKVFYPIFHLLFGISRGGCYPVLIGFLSGIPVGAKSIADLVENDSISLKEGQFLLGFCNNASPMFIMSFVAISQLKQEKLSTILLVIIYFSAILSSILFFQVLKIPYKINTQKKLAAQNIRPQGASSSNLDFTLLDSAIMDGFEVITKVGGYIILFSIPVQIIAGLNINHILKLLLISFLEITTGVNQISQIPLNLNLKIALIAMITAFGGLSGLAQTKSVISNTRLSIRTYFFVKLINMMIAFIITYLYVNLIF